MLVVVPEDIDICVAYWMPAAILSHPSGFLAAAKLQGSVEVRVNRVPPLVLSMEVRRGGHG